MKPLKSLVVIGLVVALLSQHARAVVSLSGTRLVFDGRFHEATLDISNPGAAEVLVQAWLENPQAATEERGGAVADLPFAVTPPLTRLAAQGKQTLRVLYEGVGLARDRETLLHLYVLEVPRRSAARQQLNLAVRQRINLFYRPQGLAGDPALATQALIWQRMPDDPSLLRISNPTPFYVALNKIDIDGARMHDDVMLDPFSSHALRVPPAFAQRALPTLTFKALTDYGGQRDFCAQPQDSAPFHARPQSSGPRSSIGTC
ncbi:MULTISPECIES: molecular chaperone [unclassified Pseudomonas]|uniref:fimbrial biogenesis chaperone n=1 Tax=unclassified Pseudomonas TaxID=196821 RepID=UPI000D37788B|nr:MULTISPECIES: molecular chaperone [unclassified Pseudomonas]RAU49604.1 molecular chaperone [Pseudomonas sp. RIT 409]RAU55657.1 molecular chaperone [Pseudomonas sp. RIT 412]